MLPSYDPNDNEAGLQLLEDLTTNASQIQQQVLEEILTKNANTEYLKGFLHGLSDKENFKKKVPIVNYEDIRPFIERIANGEPSTVISSQPITELLTRHNTFILFIFFPSVVSMNFVNFFLIEFIILMQLRHFRRTAENDAFNC